MKKLLALAILSCGVIFGADTHKVEQDSAHKDYIVKCDKCVITVLMNQVELEAFKKEMGDAYEAIVDDANYYSFKLSQYLERHNVESLLVDRLEYTRLVFSDTTIIPIDSIKKNEFGMYSDILYIKGKKPTYLQNSVMFEPEINSYFGIVKKD